MSMLLTVDGYTIPQVLAVRDELLQGKSIDIHGESVTVQSLHENLESADAAEEAADAEPVDARDLD